MTFLQLVFIVGTPNYSRAEPSCLQNQLSLNLQAEDLFVSGCVPTCAAVLKLNSEKATRLFASSCREFSENSRRGVSLTDLEETVASMGTAVAECLPRAYVLAGEDLIGLANSVGKLAWQTVAGSSEQEPAGESPSKSVNSVPSAAVKLPTDLSACLKSAAVPLDCLSIRKKIAIGTVCLGKMFTDRYKRDMVENCANGVKVLAPIPMPKAVLEVLPTLNSEKALAEEAGAVAKSEVRSVVTESATISRSKQLEEFLTQYKEMSVGSEAENRKFIELASRQRAETEAELVRGASQDTTRYFDVENAVMKKLNDVTNDKDLITGLTNFQKVTFLHYLEPLRKEYPDFDFSVYSDFKSVKVSIRSQIPLSEEKSAELFKKLNGVYSVSNLEFAKKMKSLNVSVAALDHADKWFRAGYGRSVDEASIAARRARQTEGESRALDFSSDEVKTHMNEERLQVEAMRRTLSENPHLRSLFERADRGMRVPKEGVFDLIRKNEDTQELALALNRRYQLAPQTVSVQDAENLKNYIRGVDGFSPTILIPKRELVNLDRATNGGASADFLGMGAANLRATAEGISGQTTLHAALVGARRGEQKVTDIFQRRMADFKKIVGGEVKCSGDDCIHVTPRALSEAEKIRIVSRLARNANTRGIRLSFVGSGVVQEARMQLATHGESIEKAFRKELEHQLSYQKMSKMTFGFDMQTVELGRGQVNLIIGKSRLVTLSKPEQAAIQNAFARALKKVNLQRSQYLQGRSATERSAIQFMPGIGILGLQGSSDSP